MSAKIIELAARGDFKPVARVVPLTERSVADELCRARRRIAQLERSLSVAMKDSLANYNRARDAERRLQAASHDPG